MSLLQIQNPPTAETAVIHLHPSDNAAVARVHLPAGQMVRAGGVELRAIEPIPPGHKVALRDIAAGEPVVRYGSRIGSASAFIAAGSRVHTHNLVFEDRMAEHQYEAPATWNPPLLKGAPTFLGYPRPDGRVGTRNYIAVAAASNCASHAAELIAGHFRSQKLPEGVDGVAVFPHAEGCGHSIGPDTEQLHRVIAGVMDHPNVAEAVMLGLGCEVNQISGYSRVTGLTLQASGGTRGVVEEGIRQVRSAIERAAEARRTEVPASAIRLGLNCGGSDAFSGVSSNPALGFCCDLLAAAGATVVLAETTEIFGAEQLLLRRAVSAEVARRLLGCVEGYKKYLAQFGGSFDDNPSPGNKEGGLSNIVEKSLGAVAKSGTSPLREVVEYAGRISGPGLVFMNTPGYDPVSLTGLAAGGVNMIGFTTGRGSAIGFPTVPVLKISSNSQVFHSMRDNIDVNGGRIIDGEATIEDVGREIFAAVLDAASGRRTSSEILGHREFVPWRIGPVL